MKHLRAAFPKESAKTFQNLSFDFGNSHIRCQLLQFLLSEFFALSRNFMAFNLYDSDISVTLALVKSTSIIVPKYCC